MDSLSVFSSESPEVCPIWNGARKLSWNRGFRSKAELLLQFQVEVQARA